MSERVEIGVHRDGKTVLDYERASNRHIAIFGRTGSGKSVAGQMILRNIAANEIRPIVVFDMHRLFASENLFSEAKDDILAMTNDVDAYSEGISLPLFTPMKYLNGREEDMLDVVTNLVEAFSLATRLGARQKECLFQAFEFVAESGTYKKEGIRSLKNALKMADDEKAAVIQERLGYLLTRNIFRDGALFIRPRSINVLRISDFPDSVQSMITEILLAYLWRLANTGVFLERGLCLYLDECQILNWGKNSILPTILAEGRKFGLQLIFTTQTLGESSKAGMVKCMLQAGTQLYFSPPENEVSAIAKILGEKRRLYWQMQLKSLNVGECVANGSYLVNGVPYTGALKIKI